MSREHAIDGDSLKSRSTPAMAVLQPDVMELAAFVRKTESLRNNVAFWRSKARFQKLESVTMTLRSQLIGFDEQEYSPQQAEDLLSAFTEILEHLNRIVDSIPFRNKVGLLRRNLISTFQQVFILRHLCQAIVCRLRLQLPGELPLLPAGSLVDSETRTVLRESLGNIGSGWDKESWNVYDYL